MSEDETTNEEEKAPTERRCSSCGKVKPIAEFPGAEERCRVCADLWADFWRQIDLKLAEARPARAGVDDRAWREEVYGWARNHIPNEANLVRTTAQQQVDNREKIATRRGNDWLRAYYDTGRGPLFWDATPIRVGEEHVRLDAATIRDGVNFEQERRRSAKQKYDSELVACDAMHELVEMAREQGYMRLSQLGDLPPRSKAAEG